MSDKSKEEVLSPLMAEMFRKNEHTSNVLVGYVMLLMGLFCACVAFVGVLGIYDVGSLFSRVFIVIEGVFLLLSYVIVRKHGFDDPWVKWFLISAIIAAISVNRLLFYATYSFVTLIPVFISTRYYNKSFAKWVAIISWFSYVLTCTASVLLEKYSVFFKEYHSYMGIAIWRLPGEVYLYEVLPITFAFLLAGFICVNVARNGWNLVQNLADSAKTISSMESEIALAAKIQSGALPPAEFKTPNGDFSLKAAMTPAKEVAGDFYDYFIVNKDTLVIIMADVSDKGIPAAMFMMSAKRAIRFALQSSHTLEEATLLANKYLLQNNDNDMFVTVWLGAVNIRTGYGKFVNSGHLPPILKHADGGVRILENEPQVFLGMFKDIEPKSHPFKMEKGDMLLLYTDGATDALNKAGESFDLDGIVRVVREKHGSPQELCDGLVDSIQKFSKGTEPFDDTTVLALQCNVEPFFNSQIFKVPAKTENIQTIMDGVNAMMEAEKCSEDDRRTIDVVLDELCANIVDYAYDGKDGNLEVVCRMTNNYIQLHFIDSGNPFNPLKVEEPKPGTELEIGGLGIHFVRNMVDEMSYEYKNGQNVLTVSKVLGL